MSTLWGKMMQRIDEQLGSQGRDRHAPKKTWSTRGGVNVALIPDRTMGLVFGYDKGYSQCAPVLRELHRIGLLRRFAIVLDTHRHDCVDMYFDAELYFSLVSHIADTIRYDTLLATMQDSRVFRSLKELDILFRKTPREDQEPPLRIEFHSDKVIQCSMETEFWVYAGGPSPYSDSYTISIYTHRDRSHSFASICRKVASDLDVTITREIEGSPEIPKMSGWFLKHYNTIVAKFRPDG